LAGSLELGIEIGSTLGFKELDKECLIKEYRFKRISIPIYLCMEGKSVPQNRVDPLYEEGDCGISFKGI
jgi:hypothetical protein